MKKIVAFLLVIAMVIAAVGCTSAPTQTAPAAPAEENAAAEQAPAESASGKKELSIAHIAPNNDVSQTELENLIRAKVDEVNSDPNSGYTLTYDHFNSDGDIQTQISQIENVIVKGYDYLVIFGVDTQGVASTVQKAHEAGVKIVDICNLERPDIIDFAYLPYNEFVYADYREQFLLDYCEAHQEDLPLKTLVMYGLMSQVPQLPRGDRMVEFAKNNPDKFEILDTNSGEWKTDKAQAITEDWIQAYPEIDYICASNDTMAIGIIQALKAANMLDKVLVTSIDITPEGLQLISDGELELSVGADQGNAAVELIDNIIANDKGELQIPDDKIIYIEKVWPITKEALPEYEEYRAAQGRPLDVK